MYYQIPKPFRMNCPLFSEKSFDLVMMISTHIIPKIKWWKIVGSSCTLNSTPRNIISTLVERVHRLIFGTQRNLRYQQLELITVIRTTFSVTIMNRPRQQFGGSFIVQPPHVRVLHVLRQHGLARVLLHSIMTTISNFAVSRPPSNLYLWSLESWVWFWVLGSGFWVLGSGFWVLGLGVKSRCEVEQWDDEVETFRIHIGDWSLSLPGISAPVIAMDHEIIHLDEVVKVSQKSGPARKMACNGKFWYEGCGAVIVDDVPITYLANLYTLQASPS